MRKGNGQFLGGVVLGAIAAGAAAQPPAKIAGGELEDHLVAAIAIGGGRAEGMAVSPDGKRAWLAMGLSRTVFCLDTAGGRYVRGFGKLGWPQAICCCPADGRLHVVDDARSAGGRAVLLLRTFDPNTGRQVRQVALDDWRLYRPTDAAAAADGSCVWVSTQPNCTDRWGYTPAALFRVDLKSGRCERIIGPAADQRCVAGPESFVPMRIALGPGGRLFAANAEPNCVSLLPPGADGKARHLKLPFAPTHLCAGRSGRLVAAGDGRLAVIDANEMGLLATVSLKGTPTALCLDRTGWMAFVAVKGSSRIRQLDVATGALGPDIDASRPGGIDAADSVRGRSVGDIVALAFAERPRRLIGLGYDGYTPFVVTLDGKQRRYCAYREPSGLAVDGKTGHVRVSFAGGLVAEVDVAAGQLVGLTDSAERLAAAAAAHGARTGAGIACRGATVTLRLADGSEVAIARLGNYGPPAAVGIGADERLAFAATDGGASTSWLLVFRLAARP